MRLNPFYHLFPKLNFQAYYINIIIDYFYMMINGILQILRAVFFISGNGGYRPSQIYLIFLYVLAYYVIGKIVTQFVSVLYSFRFIAWAICQLEIIPIINNIVFSPIFIFLDIFSKPNFSYMIIYVKAHNSVNYKFIVWRGCGKSPLTC